MKATTGQLTKLALAFADHGIGHLQRDDRLWLCSHHAGRTLTSSSELTKEEAHTLIERLERLPRGSLQMVLAGRPAPAPTEIVCTRGSGQVSEHDRQVIEAFGAELEARAQKARTRIPLMLNGEPNPTGTGRYCPPAVCWCGGCPQWKPIPPIDWSKVPGSHTYRGDSRARQGSSSWDDRSEATWIDAL